jgi:hypothetical protein
MSGLTNATRTLIRSIVIAACVAALALAAAQRAEATQTDHEVDPSEAAAFQKALCEAAGGKATVDVSRYVGYYPTTFVTCAGGLLDGMYCINTVLATICTYPVVRPEEPPAVAPTEGIEPEPEPTVPSTEIVDEAVAPTDGVETEPEPTVPPTDFEGDVVPSEGADEPVVEEPVVEDAGQDLPENPAQDETTAPTEDDPAADPNAGAGGGEVVETHVVSGEYAGIVFVEIEDEQP